MTRATSLASRTSAFSVIHHNILDNGSYVGRALRPTDAARISVPVPL
ncbi:MAG: hypothetical protein ABTQ27_15860 [Amaricoccus sp.]